MTGLCSGLGAPGHRHCAVRRTDRHACRGVRPAATAPVAGPAAEAPRAATAPEEPGAARSTPCVAAVGSATAVTRRQALALACATAGAVGCHLGVPQTATAAAAAAASVESSAAPQATPTAAAAAELASAWALVTPANSTSSADAASSAAAQRPPDAPPLHRFTSVAEAASACPAGGLVLVAAGRYRERLVLPRPVTLRAWPQGAAAVVVWETSAPYESTVEIAGPTAPTDGPETADGGNGGSSQQVVLEGLTIRHASKSVANNYGIFIRAGAPLLRDCDVSSATGAGVGVEGASPQLLGCRVHHCARQGVSIFGPIAPLDDGDGLFGVADAGLMYGMSGGAVQDCDVYGNALDGVLVRGGASPDLRRNLIHNNGGAGVNLQDCGGVYEGNTVYDNARGAVAVSALFELDAGDLAGSNSLRGLLRRL